MADSRASSIAALRETLASACSDGQVATQSRVEEWAWADQAGSELPFVASAWRTGACDRLTLWVGRSFRSCRAFTRFALPEVGVPRESSTLWVVAGDLDQRLWAIEHGARCPAVGAVVADGRGLTVNQTRRVQLAAEASPTGCVVVLLREAKELRQPSAARLRGVLEPTPGPDESIRWNAQLLRRKGARPTDDLAEGERVVLEYRHGKIVAVRPSADVVDRPGEAQGPGHVERRAVSA